MLTTNLKVSDDNLTMLSAIIGRRAFVTFTSGTTGKPKAIVHTHGSALWQARSYRLAGLVSHTDIIAAWASSSFVIHLMELAYCWPNGASLLVFKEGGHMDADYLTRAIERHRATYLLTNPLVLPILSNLFRQQPDLVHRFDSLRILSTAGEDLCPF